MTDYITQDQADAQARQKEVSMGTTAEQQAAMAYLAQQRAAMGITNYTPQQLQQQASTYMQNAMQGGQNANVNGVEGLMNAQGAPVALQTVDKNALVGNQLNGLLDQNSPYIQHAYAQGLSQAAASGMLNSSMAAGDSYNAAVGAALPIAQANAMEYANVNAANQGAANQYNVANLQAQTQAGAAGLNYAGNLQSAQLSANQSGINAGLSYAGQLGSAQISGQSQIAAANAMAGGQVAAAQEYANAQLQGQQLQYKEYTAGLAQNQQQFGANLAQNASQFNANLDWTKTSFGQQLNQQANQFAQNLGLNYQQLNQQNNQFMSNMNYNWASQQENFSHQDWQLGVQLQASSLNDYSNALQGMMQNPNMTAADRSAAIANLQSIFGGSSQQFANIPTWKNPYAGGPPPTTNPNYWNLGQGGNYGVGAPTNPAPTAP